MKYKNRNILITCDGGAATGKSTGAKLIAKKYKLAFLSSGLLYRYASYLILKNKPKRQINFLKKKFKNLNYKKLSKINLHSPKISEHSATIAKKQQTIDEDGNAIELVAKGRHDPCVGIRAVPIGEAMAHCVILDHYLMNKAQCEK